MSLFRFLIIPINEFLNRLTDKYGNGITKYFVISLAMLMIPIGFAFWSVSSLYLSGLISSFFYKISESLGNLSFLFVVISSFIIMNTFFIIIGVALGLLFAKITKHAFQLLSKK